jgi:hypothetical protein
MTKVVVDASFGAKVMGLTGAVELCDESGQTIGYFQPVASGTQSPSPRAKSPFSEEEIERRRKEKGGRALQDILADLNRQ